MTHGKVGLGRRGESLAAEALARHGFDVVTRNWHCPAGEVDLVARQDGEWYFIEVRTRRGARQGTPEQSITPSKATRMETVARTYLGEEIAALDVTWHLSVVAVGLDRSGRLLRLTFYPNLESAPQELL